MDNLTKKQRSEVMSRIRSKDTAPEIAVRHLLSSYGFRYSTHVKDLPGRPDIVFKSRGVAIFVHGCFWHKHNCKKGRSTPRTRARFWATKRAVTQLRDRVNMRKLRKDGWKALVIWECQIGKEAFVKRRLLKALSP